MKASELLYLTHRVAQEGFTHFLFDDLYGTPARKYLKSRGITSATAQEYGLGYAPSSEVFFSYLSERGISPHMAESAGLLKRSKDPALRGYCRFQHRVMFPFRDLWGRVVGHAGRIIHAGDSTKVKYTNSPNSEIFQKREILYGLYEALQTIQKRRSVYLVEGYMDVLPMVQRGFRNVLATCGTSITDYHIHLCRVLGSRIQTIFDTDEAGQKAARQCQTLAAPHGVKVENIVLPGVKDPGEWFTNYPHFP